MRKRELTNFSVSNELMARLRAYRLRTHVPMSRVVEDAVMEYLDKQESKEKGGAA